MEHIIDEIPGMKDYVKKQRAELGVTEHCTECCNCGLCIKSKIWEDMRKEQ